MSEDGFAETTVESSEEVGSHKPDVDIYAIRVGCLFALSSLTENATVSTLFETLRNFLPIWSKWSVGHQSWYPFRMLRHRRLSDRQESVD